MIRITEYDSYESIVTEGTIYCAQVLYWVGGGCGESVEKKKSAAGQFAVKHQSETSCWTQEPNRQDYGVHKYWVLLAVVRVNTVEI